jgi:excisionase family DNA binding protein
MKREDWCTLDEAMTLTGRSKTTIYRWRQEGRLHTLRPGRTLLLSRSDLLEADQATLPPTAGQAVGMVGK